MSRVMALGYNDSQNEEGRYNARVAYNKQRTEDYRNGKYALLGGHPAEAPQFLIDYIDYYKKRGYHPRSLGSNGGFTYNTIGSLMNMRMLDYASEIRSPVLMIHGEKAHSRYFSEDAFKLLKGDNKELYIVEGARHTDLYDQMDKIPFDKLEDFFKKSL